MENRFSLQEMLEVIWGRLINLCEDEKILLSPSQICTDTRNIKKGDLFVALKGERFDGHDFVDEAHRKGAQGAIVSNPDVPVSNNFFLIQVKDTLRALQELAKFHRHKFSIPLIAVTGSNGKTTVKELIAHILSTRYEVFKSEGNLNNQIGVPLSVLSINSCHQMAVLELGMNRPGEIEILSRVTQPTIGIITNVHSSHLGFLGSLSNIARAKAEIIPFLNKNRKNCLVLNEDDSWSDFFKRKTTCEVVTFGIYKHEADLKAQHIRDEGTTVKFKLSSSQEQGVPFELPTPGVFNVYNVLAASTVCYLLGFSLSEIKTAVQTFHPPSLHYQIEHCQKCNIFNDCYNANPESMRAALSTLKSLEGGRKIAVLGDMLELGEHSVSLHKSLGEFTVSVGIDALFTCGEYGRCITQEAKKGGLEDSFFFEDKKELMKKLVAYTQPEDWVLVKGSRATKMEELIKALKTTNNDFSHI